MKRFTLERMKATLSDKETTDSACKDWMFIELYKEQPEWHLIAHKTRFFATTGRFFSILSVPKKKSNIEYNLIL